jgi:Coenzyme PQQ synthesis protein D (PqqD)
MATLPRARSSQLLVEQLEDELLVYDLAADRAHRLNETAATIFRHADGSRSVEDLVDVLSEQVGVLADEDLVLITLDGLAAASLIEDYEPRATKDERLSRRRFIGRVGAVGAAATVLPVVHSIIAPTAAQAQTPCEGYSFMGNCYTGYSTAGDREAFERQLREYRERRKR